MATSLTDRNAPVYNAGPARMIPTQQAMAIASQGAAPLRAAKHGGFDQLQSDWDRFWTTNVNPGNASPGAMQTVVGTAGRTAPMAGGQLQITRPGYATWTGPNGQTVEVRQGDDPYTAAGRIPGLADQWGKQYGVTISPEQQLYGSRTDFSGMTPEAAAAASYMRQFSPNAGMMDPYLGQPQYVDMATSSGAPYLDPQGNPTSPFTPGTPEWNQRISDILQGTYSQAPWGPGVDRPAPESWNIPAGFSPQPQLSPNAGNPVGPQRIHPGMPVTDAGRGATFGNQPGPSMNPFAGMAGGLTGGNQPGPSMFPGTSGGGNVPSSGYGQLPFYQTPLFGQARQYDPIGWNPNNSPFGG